MFSSLVWKRIGSIDPKLLAGERQQLHQAVQWVAAVGRNFHLPDIGDQFGNLEWRSELNGLVGREIETSAGKVQSLLCFDEFNIQLLVDNNKERVIGLKDKTGDEIEKEIQLGLDHLGLNGSKLNLDMPYNIPDYKVGTSEPFEADQNGICELSLYFENADNFLREIKKNTEGASPVKCWPHHFDIATLITLEDTGNPETSKSMGVGLSPGDDSYPEPYFYITPWPYPDLSKIKLPKLSAGNWHTDGFVAAIITGSELDQEKSIDGQRDKISEFLQSGMAYISALVNGNKSGDST